VKQIQRLAVLVLGLWLGAGMFADIAVTRNFNTIEHFLANPGTTAAANEIEAIGRDREREILRRNAAEENNGIFHDWERAELAIGAVLIALLAFDRVRAVDVAFAGAMIAIVVVQALALSPRIAALGRLIPSMPPGDPAVAHFWTMHGIYSGSEILKLLFGFALSLRLCASLAAHSRNRFSDERAGVLVGRNG
jgi:hypothetical protein